MNLTPNEVLIILVVALIVLGPTKLPEAMRGLARGVREVRKMSTTVRHEIDNALGGPIREFQDTISGDDEPGPSPSPAATRPATPNSAFRPADEIDDTDASAAPADEVDGAPPSGGDAPSAPADEVDDDADGTP